MSVSPVNIYVCICVTVWTGICVGYMCVGRTAACIDMYKGRGPLGNRVRKGMVLIESHDSLTA